VALPRTGIHVSLVSKSTVESQALVTPLPEHALNGIVNKGKLGDHGALTQPETSECVVEM